MTNYLTAGLSAISLQSIGSILVALLVLLFMITIHEFGHYIVSKAFNFKVNEFAIGMGPAIFKKVKKNGELFSIRILPLGGFCAFEGEDDDNNDPRAFNNKKPWQRILVLIAGASMNFVAAIIIFCISIGCYGQMCMQSFEVIPPTNNEASLQNEDIILTLNGKDIYLTTDLSSALKGKKAGETVKVTVLRDGRRVDQDIKLRCDPTSENMQDLNGVLQSLGIATLSAVTKSGNTAENTLLYGDYILRISNVKPTIYPADSTDLSGLTDCKIWDSTSEQMVSCFINEQEYLSLARAYTPQDFISLVSPFRDGDNLYIFISRGADRVMLEFTLSGFDALKIGSVSTNFESLVFNYFNVTIEQVGYRMYSQNVKFGFGESITRGVVYAFKNVSSTLSAFGQLITGKLGLDALGGPVTTISITSQYVSMGFNYLLEIAGFIGVSLAVFNLLPIPALDGARAIFVLIEWIRKKPINRNVEGMIHAIGLIALLVFAIGIDLVKCI